MKTKWYYILTHSKLNRKFKSEITRKVKRIQYLKIKPYLQLGIKLDALKSYGWKTLSPTEKPSIRKSMRMRVGYIKNPNEKN